VTKRQIAGVFQEIKAHSAYNRRAGRLIEALGTCFRRRGAESGVESFGESIFLVILLRAVHCMASPLCRQELLLHVDRCKTLRRAGRAVGMLGDF